MAGAGYKLFNTGDVLTAAQVNTYLMEQTIMVFANATARDTALSGVLAQGMQCFLKDTNTMQYYSGSAWTTLSTGGDITSVIAGTGLSGGGTSGDVTLNLSTPVSATNGGTAQTTYTTGDLLYASASNTLAKRTIGTTGQVLTVSGGVPTWSTASSGSFTKVAGTTFSAVTSVSAPNSTFTSTYKIYKVFVVITSASAQATLTMKGRVSGTDSNGSWYGTNFGYRNTTTTVNDNDAGATAKTLTYVLGQSYLMNTIDLTWSNPQQATRSQVAGTGFTFDDAGLGAATSRVFGGWDINSTQYDSFSIIASTGNITGYYSVYGLEV